MFTELLTGLGLQFTYPLDVVAVYGAIVATASVVFSCIKLWLDRARVHVSHQDGMMIMNSPHFDENTLYFTISVRNRGRRTVAIGNVRSQFVDGTACLVSDSVSGRQKKVLSEENPRIEFYAEKSLLDISKIIYIQVFDETGREYREYLTRFPTFRRWLHILTHDKKMLREEKL